MWRKRRGFHHEQDARDTAARGSWRDGGEERLKKRENRWRVFSARSPGWKRKRKWLANRDFSALHCLGARLAVSDELFTQGWDTTPTWREEEKRGNGEGGRRERERGRRISFAGSTSPCDSVSSRIPPLYSSLPIREPFYLKRDVHLYALLGKIYERCRRGRGPKVWKSRGTKGPRHPSPFPPSAITEIHNIAVECATYLLYSSSPPPLYFFFFILVVPRQIATSRIIWMLEGRIQRGSIRFRWILIWINYFVASGNWLDSVDNFLGAWWNRRNNRTILFD